MDNWSLYFQTLYAYINETHTHISKTEFVTSFLDLKMSDFDLYTLKKYLFIPLLVSCIPILWGPALQYSTGWLIGVKVTPVICHLVNQWYCWHRGILNNCYFVTHWCHWVHWSVTLLIHDNVDTGESWLTVILLLIAVIDYSESWQHDSIVLLTLGTRDWLWILRYICRNKNRN